MIASRLKDHAADFLSGDVRRFDAALAEWKRVTRPRPVSEAQRLDRQRQTAVTEAGHASKRGNYAEVVRLLEPHVKGVVAASAADARNCPAEAEGRVILSVSGEQPAHQIQSERVHGLLRGRGPEASGARLPLHHSLGIEHLTPSNRERCGAFTSRKVEPAAFAIAWG